MQLKNASCCLSLIMLTGCGGSFATFSERVRDDPSFHLSMTDTEFCHYLLISEDDKSWGGDDVKLAFAELRRRGYSKRDAELISMKGVMWGTKMTFKGLKCSGGGYTLDVNKGFYPYLGHQWQVDMGNFEFVYLKGDGTESGMRVYAWN